MDTHVLEKQTFPALVSKQKEVGVKADFGTVGATFAAHELRKASQYVDAVTNTYGQDSLQVNKGLEFNVFGQPLDGVRFLAGAALIDPDLQRTAGGLYDGKRAPAVAFHKLRLAAELDVPWVPGLALTGTVIHCGPAAFDVANRFNVPAWTRVDLGARYAWTYNDTKFVARLAVENITSEAYWISGIGSGLLGLSAPRTVALSLTADLNFLR